MKKPPRPAAARIVPAPRRTRIVATLGPASETPAAIRRLLLAGMNVARFNFSHGTPAEHRRRLRTLREQAARLGSPCAALMDLQGPKIRTGPLLDGRPVELRPGRPITLSTRRVPGDASCVSTTYAGLPRDVRRGQRLLLADGLMELEVERVSGPDVRCVVITGGLLGEHKGINLPGIRVSAPSLTAKDRRDLAFGLAQGFDYVALSFVRTARDVQSLRRAMGSSAGRVPVIAKLEKPEGVEHLDEILGVVEGVMVARGDLGVELPPQKIPLVQKRIIEAASARDVIVITATQMLESMTQSPRPTRAEVSDVANAIFDGTDAVMLSEETAAGRYPVEAVAMMDAIAREVEASPYVRVASSGFGAVRAASPHAVAVAAAAATRDCGACAILCFTLSGATALHLSKQRPSAPILALTPSERTLRRLALMWGVEPMACTFGRSTDDMIACGEAEVLRRGRLEVGDRVIIVSGSVHLRSGSDMMKISTLRGRARR